MGLCLITTLSWKGDFGPGEFSMPRREDFCSSVKLEAKFLPHTVKLICLQHFLGNRPSTAYKCWRSLPKASVGKKSDHFKSKAWSNVRLHTRGDHGRSRGTPAWGYPEARSRRESKTPTTTGHSHPATAFPAAGTESIQEIHISMYFPSHLLHKFQRNLLPQIASQLTQAEFGPSFPHRGTLTILQCDIK